MHNVRYVVFIEDRQFTDRCKCLFTDVIKTDNWKVTSPSLVIAVLNHVRGCLVIFELA